MTAEPYAEIKEGMELLHAVHPHSSFNKPLRCLVKATHSVTLSCSDCACSGSSIIVVMPWQLTSLDVPCIELK
eukprot:1413172-Amphidinium_carterae.2